MEYNMSTNFHISASRNIVVTKTGVYDTQYCNYQTWQTNTKTTREILKSTDPVAAYKSWVMSISQDESVPIYNVDDPLGDFSQVKYKIVNGGTQECKNLDKWISEVKYQGYELDFYSL